MNRPPALADAYAHCLLLSRAHYENFPVASYLLPKSMRPSIAAIYAFARTADDFADLPGIPDATRIERLDDWHRRLVAKSPLTIAGNDPAFDVRPGDRVRPDPDLIFLALHDTIGAKRLPIGLFEDLLSAFRQDVTTQRYDTWSSLLDYCRRSADPVGRLVLRVAGYDRPDLDSASDAVCTALQLTNFWQDLERDWRVGRLYVPLDDRRAAGADEADLDARRWTEGWRAVMEVMAQRTRALFDIGRAVCDGVEGRLRWELRATWLGGVRILDQLETRGFDVFDRRPSLGASDLAPLVRDALLWRSPPAPPAVSAPR